VLWCRRSRNNHANNAEKLCLSKGTYKVCIGGHKLIWINPVQPRSERCLSEVCSRVFTFFFIQCVHVLFKFSRVHVWFTSKCSNETAPSSQYEKSQLTF
jgi:hypothetical protein